MIVVPDISFGKDLKKIKDNEMLEKDKSLILNIENANNLFELKNIKKLEGKGDYYRFKIKNYRLGFKLVNNTVFLLRLLHRKDIYKFFP